MGIEVGLLLVFAVCLIGAVAWGITVLAPLSVGFLIFYFYGIRKGKSAGRMGRAAWSGVRSVGNVVATMLLIGLLTASWRASGSIATIVYYASSFTSPKIMVLLSFLLCCLVSFLTGTSFGTTATIGVICMSMSMSMGLSVPLTAGAILSGSFFGDRCSPVSTSAMVVCDQTGTEISENIRRMVRTAFIPFLLTSAVYLAVGFFAGGSAGAAGGADSARQILAAHYSLSPWTLAPVIAVLALSILHVDVKITVLVSTVLALIFTLVCEGAGGVGLAQMPKLLIFGFQPEDSDLAKLMSGGGAVSMIEVCLVVGLSSTYGGMFEETGFLEGIRGLIGILASKISRFGATLIISLLTCAISCNQTLASILTYQLAERNYDDPYKLAEDMENTVIIVAPLFPWSIAGAVPLAMVGAPNKSILFAFYLMILPLWCWLADVRRRGKK